MPVCVVGMHRSGTSLVARLLSLCGLDLGPEDELMAPAPDNPDGYWESVPFVEVNEAVLNALGGDWDSPPPGPITGTEPELVDAALKARLLVERFHDREPWGWKDPRTALTLGFWRTLLRDVRVVLALRNPLEVAVSLARRNHLSLVHGLRLWARYNERVLADTKPAERVITHYDAYLHGPAQELDRVLEALALDVPGTVIAGAVGASKPSLRHSRLTAADLVDVGVPSGLVELYRALSAEAAWNDVSATRVEPAVSELGPIGDVVFDRPLNRAALELRIRNQRAGSKSAESKPVSSPRRGKAEQRDAETDSTPAVTTKPQAEFEALRALLESARADRARAREAVRERDDEFVRLRESERANEAAVAELRAEMSAITGTLDGLAADTTSLSSTLAQLRAELGRVREALLPQDAATEELRSQVAQLREGLTSLETNDDATAARRELAALARRVERLETVARPSRPAEQQTETPPAPEPTPGQRLAAQIRATAENLLPADASVLVVSKGDDALLGLGQLRCLHFPQNTDGGYAGFHPADSGSAIAQLETLRSRGAQYILFPRSAMWWLKYYKGLREHLERNYRLLERSDLLVVYALHEPAVSSASDSVRSVEALALEFELRTGRMPSILDWHTGFNLDKQLVEQTIFAPLEPSSTLPYLDASVDVVVVAEDRAELLREADRVAAGCVALLGDRDGGERIGSASIRWRPGAGAITLPSVSIVIPSYNGIVYTEPCLRALVETIPASMDVEIVVVDDCSSDDTQAVLRGWKRRERRLRVLRNRTNLGFLRTCNRGARESRKDVVILLNNDTLPEPGWLPPLLRTFVDRADAGAVGGKLVFPDGRLQEAGGVVFRDGSAANFGKWDQHVDSPLYNYVREVDYVSGALLATPRELFRRLGSFDTRFRPIYYEDTDYCFKVRQAGLRVYYQPESTVIHLEGSTSGTDTSTGDKHYQAVNRDKFVAKWRKTLARHPDPPSRYDAATWHALTVRREGVEA